MIMKHLKLDMNQWSTVLKDVDFIRGRLKCPYSEGVLIKGKSISSSSSNQLHMKLTPIAANQTQLNLNDGTEIFFSYKTPVAAKLPNYDYIRTATKWSTTTTRHINQWLEGVTAEVVDQSILDNLVG